MRSLKILSSVGRTLALGGLASLFLAVSVHGSLQKLASEYGIVGLLPGSQMNSSVAFTPNGGWVVWQDNATDGDGTGISARRLNASLSGDLNVFRVNQIGGGEQENPRVAMLNNGGAVFVWQGGSIESQRIYARFVSSDLAFISGDVLVNTFTNQHQIHPTVAVLTNGNVVVCWQSYAQDGDMYGVYGRILTAEGVPVGGEFLVNQSVALNQSEPQVASLSNGGFVVAWTSEQQQGVANTNNPAQQYAMGIFGRMFNSLGTAVGNQITLSEMGICANPFVISMPQGGFVVAWSQLDTANNLNRWDVFSRHFQANGVPLNAAWRVNATTVGDQAGPVAAVAGTNVFYVWTSMGQDGAQEGVYGQYAEPQGVLLGGEIRVNTTTLSKQMRPSLASDGSGRFLTTWSSFVGLSEGFDLMAQRFTAGEPSGLIQPSAPYVFSLSSSALNVTWPKMDGYAVAFYELFMDGSSSPIVVTDMQTTVTNLAANSTHSFRLRYQLTNGNASPLSTEATGTTWGGDGNSDGLPDDWQALQWGVNPNNWPSASADSDGDGASNLMEFLAGTDPHNAASVLSTWLQKTTDGFLFSWKTQVGMVYQLQSADHLANWQNTGLPRFAYGTVDFVTFPAQSQSVFYRVIRLR